MLNSLEMKKLKREETKAEIEGLLLSAGDSEAQVDVLIGKNGLTRYVIRGKLTERRKSGGGQSDTPV